MPGFVHLLTVTITWDPNLVEFGPFTLSWHGVFTAIGIALGVYLGAWIGRKQGFTEDDAYTIALIGVPAGIIGARIMFIGENWDRFNNDWVDMLKINEGGITLYGAIIGGVLASSIYGWIRRMPVTRGLDAAVFGLLLGMGIGRIGDLINGEHIAKASSLPWAVKYTDPDSPGYPFSATVSGDFIARHPATTYEMIGDFLIIGVLVLLFIKFWQTRPGIAFFSGVVLYSMMRFGVSYLRIDSGVNCPGVEGCPEEIFGGISFPQVVSLGTFIVGVLGLAYTSLRAPQSVPYEREPLRTGATAGVERASASTSG